VNNDVQILSGLIVSFIDVVDDTDRDDKIVITTECGKRFIFCHQQDCCERVSIYDSKGDLHSLVGKKLIGVEVATLEGEDPEDVVLSEEDKNWREHFTWTTITFRTTEDTFISRWIGESNGYYSEDVYFEELTQKNS
jgi:hypothetical protein